MNETLLTGAEAAGSEDPPMIDSIEISGRDKLGIETPDPPREAVTASPRDPTAAPRNVCYEYDDVR